MSFEAMTNLLAEGNGWGQLIGPLLLVGFYVAASIFKAVSNRAALDEDDDEEDAAELSSSSQAAAGQGRYKPLDPAAQPQGQSSPRSRTLPYARTVEQGRQRPDEPLGRDQHQRQEQARQEQIKQRRLEQVEQMRRRQLQLQEAERLRQQGRQKPQARPHQAAPPAARPSPRPARPKTPQEAVRQARAGMPVRVGSSRRDILKQSAAATAASLATKDVAPPVAAMSLRQMLKQNNSLRTAVVLKEILDTPVGLRDIGQ